MTQPALLNAAIWLIQLIELIGSALVLWWWPRLRRTGRLAGGWFLAATLFMILSRIGAATIRNAQVVTFFWFPVSAILALNALAAIHPPGRSRVAMRVLSWVTVLAWAVLAATVEEFGNYSVINSPLHAIVLAGAAAYTLVSRVDAARGELARDAGFVLSSSLLVYAVPTVFLTVAARVWYGSGETLPLQIYFTVRNFLVCLVYPVFLYGVWLSVMPRERPGAGMPRPSAT